MCYFITLKTTDKVKGYLDSYLNFTSVSQLIFQIFYILLFDSVERL